MKLLDEIINETADDNVSISAILRKCLILANTLKSGSLGDWVLHELKGYDDAPLPQYRLLTVGAKGLLLGPFGAQIRDQPLASSVLKEHHREWATKARLGAAISAYEGLIDAKNDAGSLQIPWPADLVVIYQSSFFDGYALNRAWQEIPLGAVVALLDTVRTRVLELALDLRGQIGSNDDQKSLERLPAETVATAVTNIIYGGNNVITERVSGDVRIVGSVNVVQGDFGSLSRVLGELGIDGGHMQALQAAIEQDKKEGSAKGFGDRTREWLADAVKTVGKGAGKVTTEVAVATLSKAILTYFGIQ